MAINFNAPSQVRPYANLGSFPATGALKTIYIAEDTNKTYRWTGSAYVEISQSPTQTSDLTNDGENGVNPFITALDIPSTLPPSGTAGGDLTGTYPNPTVHRIHGIDIQNGTPSTDDVLVYGGSPAKWQHQHLNASQVDNDSSITGATVKLALEQLDSTKVPTSRTLTINGITQDLSANRTFTISTGITIGTTAITSGTVGRVLFEGTGNVVQESANLFFDDTNGRLGINTSGPTSQLTIAKTGSNNYFNFEPSATGTSPYIQGFFAGGIDGRIYFGNKLQLRTTGSTSLYGLDAGTVSATNFECFPATATQAYLYLSAPASNNSAIYFREAGVAFRGAIGFEGGSADFQVRTNLSAATTWSGNERLRIFGATGNIGINVSGVDAGYKLDVNGTARVQTSLVINGSSSLFSSTFTVYQSASNRIGSLSLSTNKADSTTRTHLSLNSSETTTPQSLDFQYVGATFINDRYNLLQTSEVGVAYGGGIVLQKYGGWVGIGSGTQFASAICAITSTTKGFLPPRMTTTQKNAIASPVAGLQVFDTTLNLMSYYNGTIWISL